MQEVKVAQELPQISNIMLAVDGSENSFRACELAGVIAKGCNAKVIVVCAIQPISVFTAPFRDEHYAALEENARKTVEKVASSLINTGIPVSSQILYSRSESVVESLVDEITEEKGDLVVCGTRGLGGFKRLLLGSVSGQLVSHSPFPVLVVRKPEVKQELYLKKILMATDGSEGALRATGLAISLAKALEAKLTFANVAYLPPTSYIVGAGFDQAMERLRGYGEQTTAAAVSLARNNGITADSKVDDEMQSPVFALTNIAEKENYDLIVLGTRGLGGFKKLALGSVADGVLHYAHCSVLISK